MAIATMRVPTVFTAVDRFSDVVSKMTRNVDRFGDTASAAAMRASSKMISTGKNMMATSAVMLGGLYPSVKSAVKFEDQMDKINTILHKSPNSLKTLSEEVKKFSSNSVNSLDDITSAYLDLASSGMMEKKIMPMINIGEKLSIGGIGTLKDATDVLLAKERAFPNEKLSNFEMANQAQKIMKHGIGTLADLAPVYSKGASQFSISGGSSAEYDAMISALTSVKQSMPEAVVEIMQMVTSAQKGSKNIGKIYDELKIKSFSDLVKKNKGQVLKSFQEITNTGKKMGFNVNQIWANRNASIGISLLTKNVSVLDQFTKAYNDTLNTTNNELDKAYSERSNNAASILKKFNNQIELLKIEVGNALLPLLRDVLKELKPLLQSFSKFIKENPGAVTGFAKTAIAIGAIGTALTAGGWLLKLGALIYELPSLAGISTTVFGAMELWAGYAGITVGVLCWEILLVVGAIGLLAWAAYDMYNHWSDWQDILITTVMPLWQIVKLFEKIQEHSDSIKNAFKFDGFLSGIKQIGIAIIDFILTPLIKIMDIQSRLPLVGSKFKQIADLLRAVKQDMNAPSVTPSPIPTSPTKPTENLAGKTSFNAKDIMDAIVKKSMSLDLNLHTPEGYVLQPIGSSPKGLEVKTTQNQGSRDKFWQ